MVSTVHRISLVASVLVLSAASVVAQPVIGKNTIPAPGQRYVKVGYDTTSLNPGPGGPNQTWDFSSLPIRKDSVVVRTISPTEFTQTQRTTYPTAQFAVVDDTVFRPYRTSTTLMTQLGEESPASKMVVQSSNPLDNRPVDLTFNQQHNDSYNAVVTAAGIAKPLTRGGTISLRYDGYGTLLLGKSTFSNVARLQSVLSASDTVRNGSSTTIYRTVTSSAVWYMADSPEPVLALGTITRVTIVDGETTEGPFSSTFAWGRRTEGVVSSVDETQASAVVAPNPVEAGGTIQISASMTDASTVSIIDGLGRTISLPPSAIQATENGARIHVPMVDPGAYGVVVTTGDVITRYRIIVR